MGEIGSSHWTIYPKIASSFGPDASAQIGKAAGPGLAAFQKQSDDAGKKSGKTFGESFRTVAAPLLAGAAIHSGLALVRSSVDAFSELQDATSAAGVVFGDSMQIIIDQSKNAATTLGLSRKQVIDSANTFGTFGKSAGLAGDDLAQFSVKMTQIAGDLASFKGGSPEEAIEAVGAALRGESEPIRRYGVLLDDMTLRQQAVTMGLIKTTKEGLTPQQRVLAAQAEILKQTTDAQGDFARTADSTANVSKTLAAEQANLAAEIGEKLAPAITEAQRAGIGLIDWVTQNQAAIVPFVGTMGTLTLAVGGFVLAAKGIEALKAARATLVGLGDAFQNMGTKAKIATASAGAVGIALTALSIIYGVVANEQAKAQQAVDDFTTALEASNGAIDGNVTALARKRLEDAGALKAAQDLGLNLDTVTQAALGNADALKVVNERLAESDAKWSGAASATTAEAKATGTLRTALGDTSGALKEAQEKAGRLGLTTQSNTTATIGNTNSVLTNTGALTANIDKMNARTDALLKQRSDHRGFEAAVDDATAALKKNGKTLNENTEKGRANQDALDGIAQKGRDWVQSLKDQGASSERVNAAQKEARTSFIKTATAMGMGATEAARLATKLGLTKDAATKSKDKLRDLQTQADKLNGKKITFSVSASMNKSADEIVYSVQGGGRMKFTAKALGGYAPPGLVLRGEGGPELTYETRPTYTYTAQQTRQILAGARPVSGSLAIDYERLADAIASRGISMPVLTDALTRRQARAYRGS